MVPGLVLASGRSARMGRPKALLPCGPGGCSFLAKVVTTLTSGGITDIVVVGRAGDEGLKTELERLDGGDSRLRYASNPNAEMGQLSSVVAGLSLADRPGVLGILVIPVDMPLVLPATVRQLLAIFNSTRAPIVRPVHQGAHGHPVIFSRVLFDQLRHADPSIGARSVVRAHADVIVDVEVADPGTITDVDTPEDYARLFGDARST
jgi:molybdenum cofactor cytidylyltransferase